MERLLTVEDVCQVFRFKLSYVYRLTHEGRIPDFKIGNHLRFRQTDLEQWLAAQSQGNANVLREEEVEYHARLQTR